MSAFDVGKRHPGALTQMVHDVDRESTVKLHTANGDVDGKRGHAATIQVRSLLARMSSSRFRAVPSARASTGSWD